MYTVIGGTVSQKKVKFFGIPLPVYENKKDISDPFIIGSFDSFEEARDAVYKDCGHELFLIETRKEYYKTDTPWRNGVFCRWKHFYYLVPF